jgi:hypothetical protein
MLAIKKKIVELNNTGFKLYNTILHAEIEFMAQDYVSAQHTLKLA